MEKMKYWIIAGVSALFLLLAIWIIYLCVSVPKDELDRYDEAINYLNNEVDVQLLLYGEDVEFREAVHYSLVSEISEDSLQSSSKYIYLIINDINGNVDFDIEDVRFLKEYADANNSFNFIYIGEEKLNLFISGGVFEDYGTSSDDRDFGYIIDCGDRIIFTGIWSVREEQRVQRRPELLGESIIAGIASIIKSNE